MKQAKDIVRHKAIEMLSQFQPYPGESKHPHANMFSHSQMIEMFCAGFFRGGTMRLRFPASSLLF